MSHDSRNGDLAPGPFAHLGHVHVRNEAGGYGDFSHLARYFAAARQLADLGEEFDWVCNISGQDYPVVGLGEAESLLATTTNDAFVETFQLDSEASHWSPRRVRTRYGYRYRRMAEPGGWPARASRPFALIDRVQPWYAWSSAYGAVGRRSPAPAGLELRGGSFFGNLSARALHDVMAFLEGRPDVVRWARGVLAPEEMLIPTVLATLPHLRVENDCKRFFDFHGSKGNHPRTLTESDVVPALSSGAWFARKFDERAPALDLLDAHLDGLRT